MAGHVVVDTFPGQKRASPLFNNCHAGHAMRNALDMLKTLLLCPSPNTPA